MTRIDIPEPAPVGVHYFKGRSKKVPASIARILHFESCKYEDWKVKFTASSPSNFIFYKDSRLALQEYQACLLSHPSRVDDDHDHDHDHCEKKLYDFYTSRTSLDSASSSFKIRL